MPSLVVVTASISNIDKAAGPSIVEATLRIASSQERPLFNFFDIEKYNRYRYNLIIITLSTGDSIKYLKKLLLRYGKGTTFFYSVK